MLQDLSPFMTLLERIISAYHGGVCEYYITQENNPGWLPIFVLLTEQVGGNMASDVDDGGY